MSERAKQAFLSTFDRELATTLKVLRSMPEDQRELKPSPRSNSARDLAWTFVLERRLGTAVWHDAFASGMPAGSKPEPAPETLAAIIETLESESAKYRELIAGATVETLDGLVHFFTAPKTMGQLTRMDLVWFLLHDEIHHRGQFTVYLRIAGAKVPSVYGPSGDEPWI